MKTKKLKSQALGLLAVGALLLSSCTTVPTQVDTGPIPARTFSFINGGIAPTASFADNRAHVHAVIQQSLTDNLTARGLTKVGSGSDITVAYLVIIGNNATTEMINQYFGYGRDAAALQEKAHEAYTGSTNPHRFAAGTLLVDLIDSRNHQLLRRTHVTRPLLKNPSAEVRAANIQEVVTAALADLRLQP
jgi:hypothetical protein